MQSRSLLAAVALVACAAPTPAVNCVCSSVPVEKAVVEGDFLVRVEAIVVESGEYVAPAPSSVASPTTLTITERWLSGTYGAATTSIDISSHLQLVETPGSSGGCCGSSWDGLSLDLTPRPWSERNAIRASWGYDTGDVLADIDPSVAAYAVLPSLETATAHRFFAPDADGLGFATNAWFEVRAPGCEADDCASILRVERHFRRPE
jgi:hypothetical protein